MEQIMYITYKPDENGMGIVSKTTIKSIETFYFNPIIEKDGKLVFKETDISYVNLDLNKVESITIIQDKDDFLVLKEDGMTGEYIDFTDKADGKALTINVFSKKGNETEITTIKPIEGGIAEARFLKKDVLLSSIVLFTTEIENNRVEHKIFCDLERITVDAVDIKD